MLRSITISLREGGGVTYRHRNCGGGGGGGGGVWRGVPILLPHAQHQLMCLLLFLLSVVAAYYVEIMSTSVVLANSLYKVAEVQQ